MFAVASFFSVIKCHFYSNLSAIKVIEQTKFNENEPKWNRVKKKPTQITMVFYFSFERNPLRESDCAFQLILIVIFFFSFFLSLSVALCVCLSVFKSKTPTESALNLWTYLHIRFWTVSAANERLARARHTGNQKQNQTQKLLVEKKKLWIQNIEWGGSRVELVDVCIQINHTRARR